MKVKPRGKKSVSGVNHDEARVRVQKPTQGLKVKTNLKAGVFGEAENSARQSNYSRVSQDIN